MNDVALVLVLLVLAIAIVLIAVRLRSTPSAVQLKDSSGSRLDIRSSLSKELASVGSQKPVVTISMRTIRTASGEARSTEAITIDGQTYDSIEDIPPEVRDRVRTLLAKARKPGSAAAPGNEAALVKIEDDLAALGLDLRNPEEPREGPPGTT